MFTGIVEKSVPVLSVSDTSPGVRRITITNTWPDVHHGESIANNGVCLTVAGVTPSELSFDVITETLNKTNLGLLKPGDLVHVERALAIGDRIDGHFVQGHVDGTAKLIQQINTPEETRLKILAPDHLAKYLAPKGSVSIDGVSLTIASVNGPEFEVALIPTTLRITQLGNHPTGWPFNLEADVLSKTIVYYLEQMGITKPPR